MKGIYQYKDLKNDEIVYIGKDSYIDKNKRHKDHMASYRYDDQQFNRILQNNPDRYEYSILYSSDDVSENDLNMLEMTFIERYNPKFNFTKGGDGISGYKHTEETKRKMSENNARYWKGKKVWNTGKTRSEKTKQKISESKNTSGYYHVYKQKDKKYKQGFKWRYHYCDENGKQKSINSTSIDKLEEKVKAKGLKWKKFEEEDKN